MMNDPAHDPIDVDLDRVWLEVSAGISATPIGQVEVLAARLLRSPGLARALMTTPSLVLSWLVASVVVLAAGVLATSGTDVAWVPLLAPALAAVGISYAYGPGVDPAFELSQSMAISDRMVLLVRVVAVFGVNALLGMTASLMIAPVVGLTLLWLLPMTTVSAFGLTVATLARSANTGVAAALAGWGIFILAGAYRADDIAMAVTDNTLVPVYLIGTAVCAVVALYATSGARTRSLEWR